ncbi:DinB family protein [Flavicella sediminum]|uniref:DinB family protein n=1 Tax=Flavicella sediminum TaxID=2585141 RepID=UPI001121E629|nr:DinB family protein [Flavicella sediminum]
MIEAIVKNLQRGIYLLNTITEEQYKDISVAPYYSSIGGHIRHIMDVYDCVFEGLPSGTIDLTARKRNPMAEQQLNYGIAYIQEIIEKVEGLDSDDFQKLVQVSDDLGEGVFEATYTLSALLIQSHSHATHHYASIGYIIFQLGIELPDNAFGFNPTTPVAALKE